MRFRNFEDPLRKAKGVARLCKSKKPDLVHRPTIYYRAPPIARPPLHAPISTDSNVMLTLVDARALISSNIAALPAEPVLLSQAHHRILRLPACAPEDIPAFERSAMDGYAVNDTGSPQQFVVVGEIQAGATPSLHLSAGECVRIFTGAQIPNGATRVLLQEHVLRTNNTIVPKKTEDRTWIRHRGEDAIQGSVLLPVGTKLGAGELAMLAGVGLTMPQVSKQPRVLHFATGNELVAPDKTPLPGQIRDSNSILISALLAESGARLLHHERVADTLESLVHPVNNIPTRQWDLLLISGGASVGDFDFGARALVALGFTIHFQKVNLRPGKPLIFATRKNQAAFVIPGNPVSHLVTFHLAIRHAIQCFLGLSGGLNLTRLPLVSPLPAMPDSRETWWPTRVQTHDGELQARPLSWQSSGDLRGLLGANALLRIAPGAGNSPAGSLSECLILEPNTLS